MASKRTGILGTVATLRDRLFGEARSPLVAGVATEAITEDVWLPTLCAVCNRGPDLIRVHRVNGVALGVEGNPEFKELSRNHARICPKPYGLLQKAYYPYRIKAPLKRTNPERGIGVDPKWVEISWDEALNTTAEKLKKIRAEDPRKFGMAGGGAGSTSNDCMGSWTIFQYSFGAEGRMVSSIPSAGTKCTMADHMWGNYFHGAFTCDAEFAYCNYYLVIGRNPLASGGVPESYAMAKARARGMKMVVVDPILSVTAAKADEWIPIKPGTDTAFYLGLIHTIIHEIGVYDEKFLKEMTNSPYLVGPDGHWVRDAESQKPLVWDAIDNTARVYDDPRVKDFALLGSYSVAGVPAKPAFQMLKEHVKEFTPEWASDKTEIPAATIRRIAREWVDNARIGSTITIEGEELPFRPVSTKKGRGVSGVLHGTQVAFGDHILAALVGALEVPGGHVGGTITRQQPYWGITPGEDGLLDMATFKPNWPLDHEELAKLLLPFERIFATTEGGSAGHFNVMSLIDPPQPGYEHRLEAGMKFRCNHMVSSVNFEIMEEAYQKIPFQVAISYVIDETTAMADIVLPDTTDAEHFTLVTEVGNNKGMWSSNQPYSTGMALKQPVVQPMYQVRHLYDILADLAERIGILGAYNQIFCAMALGVQQPPFPIDMNKKHRWEDMVALACQLRTGKDVAWWKEHGAILRPLPVKKQYQVYFAMKEKKLRYSLPYFEHMLDVREELETNLKRAGIDWWDTTEYVPLPIYLPSVLEEEPPEYDFYVSTERVMQFAWGNNTELPWLLEVSEHVNGVPNIVMNAEAGRARGIKDGDKIWVESGAGRTSGTVKLIQGIRPDTLLMSQCFGYWSTPMAKDSGRPGHNALLPVSWDWVDPVVGAIQAQTVKGKVYKA